MTRQEIIALWEFAEQLPKGSRLYNEVKALLIEELKGGIKQ
jgi:hypothetical protein